MFFSNGTQLAQLWQVMKNTFAMSFLSIATSVLPLMFAVFLSEIKCKWFKNIVQTMTTLPNFISWVLVYSVAFSLFSNTGMVNTLLQNLGLTTEAVKFLDSDSHTWAFHAAVAYMEESGVERHYVSCRNCGCGSGAL